MGMCVARLYRKCHTMLAFRNVIFRHSLTHSHTTQCKRKEQMRVWDAWMVRGCCYDNITIQIDRNLTNFFQRFLMHAPFQNRRKFIIMTSRPSHQMHQCVSLFLPISVLWHHKIQCLNATYANDVLVRFQFIFFLFPLLLPLLCISFQFWRFSFSFFSLSSFISVQFSVQSHKIGSVSVVQCECDWSEKSNDTMSVRMVRWRWGGT